MSAVTRGNVSGSLYLNLNAILTSEQEATLEDQRLLSALQSGDELAYEQLIQRFQTPVYNLAYRLLNDATGNDRKIVTLLLA